jgi:3,4-dihydroxy 2-butanone 4-phosphate synthase/GTP cyclohydrolase II
MKSVTNDLKKFQQKDLNSPGIRIPRVTLSYAQTLDGSLTIKRGQPTVLSSPESQQLTHELRSAHDAILVGVGTVISDNPRLTVRLVNGENPLPIILDPHLRTPLDSNILVNPDKKAIIFCNEGVDANWREEYTRMGNRVIPIPFRRTGELDLHRVILELESMSIRTLMVEGGGRVITGFLRERLVDYAVVTIIPGWLGGFPVMQGILGESMGEIPFIIEPDITTSGKDLVLYGRVK